MKQYEVIHIFLRSDYISHLSTADVSLVSAAQSMRPLQHPELLEANSWVAIKIGSQDIKKRKKEKITGCLRFFGEVITQFTNHINGESHHFPSWITSSRSFQLFASLHSNIPRISKGWVGHEINRWPPPLEACHPATGGVPRIPKSLTAGAEACSSELSNCREDTCRWFRSHRRLSGPSD